MARHSSHPLSQKVRRHAVLPALRRHLKRQPGPMDDTSVCPEWARTPQGETRPQIPNHRPEANASQMPVPRQVEILAGKSFAPPIDVHLFEDDDICHTTCTCSKGNPSGQTPDDASATPSDTAASAPSGSPPQDLDGFERGLVTTQQHGRVGGGVLVGRANISWVATGAPHDARHQQDQRARTDPADFEVLPTRA